MISLEFSLRYEKSGSQVSSGNGIVIFQYYSGYLPYCSNAPLRSGIAETKAFLSLTIYPSLFPSLYTSLPPFFVTLLPSPLSLSLTRIALY